MSISATSAVRVLVAVLLCAAPNGWSKTPKVKGNRKLVWVGLVVAGAGAAVFATAGHTVATPQQCALVPLATICIPPKTYTDYRQPQQLVGAGMVFTGGLMVWRGLPGR
jgi:hypothetical protein